MPPTVHFAPPVPHLRLSKESIWNLQTNTPVFSIDTSSAPGSISSKSLLTFTRCSNGQVAGTVRFHSMTGSITLTLNGAETRLRDADGVSKHKLKFRPINFPGVKWTWKFDKPGYILSDGRCTIARLTGDMLVVEPVGLMEPAIDEVVLSAMGLWGLKQRSEGGASAALEAVGAIAQLGGAGV